MQASGGCLHPDGDPGAPGRVLDRVGDEVLEDPLDLGGVDLCHHRVGVDVEAVPLGADVLERALDQGDHVGRLDPRLQDSPCHPVDVEQVCQQPVELAGASHDHAEHLVSLGR